MKKIILVLILFASCADAQIKKKQFLLLNQGQSTPKNTNANGESIIAVIGDSINAGVNGSTGAGTTPTLGTVKFYRKSDNSIQNVTTTDIVASGGTPAPQSGIDYYNATGKKLVFVPTASGNSSFFPIILQTTNNWSTSGILFDAMLTDVAAACALIGVQEPLAIFVTLGVNDARNIDAGNGDINVIYTAIDSFVSRIKSNFPGVPCVFEQIGMDGGYPVATRTINIKKKLKQVSIDETDIHLFGALNAFWQTGNYHSDLLHPKQVGNNIRGSMWTRWLLNSGYSKYSRAIISSHFDELSLTRKNLIAALIDGAPTEYLQLEYFFNYLTTTRENIYIDWAFLKLPYDATGPTFTANAGLDFNGSTYFRVGYTPSTQAFVSTLSSTHYGAYVKRNDTAPGTLKYLTDGSTFRFYQNTSDIRFFCNDATASIYGTDTSFKDNSEYIAARSGGTKYLYKNGSSVASFTVAATAVPSGEIYVPASGGSFDGLLYYARCGAGNGSGMYSYLLDLINNW